MENSRLKKKSGCNNCRDFGGQRMTGSGERWERESNGEKEWERARMKEGRWKGGKEWRRERRERGREGGTTVTETGKEDGDIVNCTYVETSAMWLCRNSTHSSSDSESEKSSEDYQTYDTNS